MLIQNDDIPEPKNLTRKYTSGQAEKMLVKKLQTNWLDSRQTKVDCSQGETSKNLQFAKDLFKTWDLNEDNHISESEIIKPLVSLGLAPDHKFVRKIL